MGIDLTENRTIAISKPPYTIALDGDIEHKDLEYTYKVLEFLSTQKLEGITNESFVVHITDQTNISKGTNLNETITESKSESIMTNPQAVKE